MKTLEDVAEFHGHVCPGLALGYRVSAFVLKAFKDRAKDEEIVAIVENDSCAVDAVQVMTGCTFGKGNLIFRDFGKQVYTFVKRPGGEAMRVSVKWEPPEDTGEEKNCWLRYVEGDRTEEVLSRVHERKFRKIREILDGGDEGLFSVERFVMEPPPEARIYKSLRCERCGEKVMEPRARIMEGKIVCLPCFSGRG